MRFDTESFRIIKISAASVARCDDTIPSASVGPEAAKSSNSVSLGGRGKGLLSSMLTWLLPFGPILTVNKSTGCAGDFDRFGVVPENARLTSTEMPWVWRSYEMPSRYSSSELASLAACLILRGNDSVCPRAMAFTVPKWVAWAGERSMSDASRVAGGYKNVWAGNPLTIARVGSRKLR
jgi:hypothetical protein